MASLEKEKSHGVQVPLRTETKGKPILVIEDPNEHTVPVFRRMSDGLGLMLNRDVTMSTHVSLALPLMAANQFELVIVHHNDFSAVDKIKSRYPDVKVAAYSANIMDHFEPGTLGEEIHSMMKERYDFVLNARTGVREQIEDTIRKIDPTAYPLNC
jgi:hypothetical protein